MRRRLFRHEQKNYVRPVSAASAREFGPAALHVTKSAGPTVTGAFALGHPGEKTDAHFAISAGAVQLVIDGFYYRFTLPAFRAQAASGAAQTELRSEIPGRIVKILAHPGQTVAAGDGLIIQEAMKMEITLKAPAAVKISEILVTAGAQVEADAVLIRFEVAG